MRVSVMAKGRQSVMEIMLSSVLGRVSASVLGRVRAIVRDSVEDSVREIVEPIIMKFNIVHSKEKEFSMKYETPWNGLGDDCGWLAWFDYFNRLGIKCKEGERYLDLVKSGIWDCLWFNDLAVITCRPSAVKKDSNGRIHCSDGPAVEWPNGEKYYYWHGVSIPEKIIMKPESITRKDIENEKNSEIMRAMAEKLGWNEYMKRAETFLVDKWFDTEKCLHYELWDFKKRFEMTPRLLKMESPEILDGTRPYYIEPVDPGLKTAEAARKWQFKKPNLKWPTVEECNSDPELHFEVEA